MVITARYDRNKRKFHIGYKCSNIMLSCGTRIRLDDYFYHLYNIRCFPELKSHTFKAWCRDREKLIDDTILCPSEGEFIGYKKAAIVDFPDAVSFQKFRDDLNDKKYKRRTFAKVGFYLNETIIPHKECIVKLRIPEHAKRVQPISFYSHHAYEYVNNEVAYIEISVPEIKCRAEFAYVEEIEDLSGNPIDLDGKICVSLRSLCVTGNSDCVNASYIEYRKGELVASDFYDRYEEIICSSGIHFFMNKENAKRFFMY